MAALMDAQRVAGEQRLSTGGAAEGPYAGVVHLVSAERAPVHEGLVAGGALEAQLAGVQPQVFLQGAGAGQLFVADGAGVSTARPGRRAAAATPPLFTGHRPCALRLKGNASYNCKRSLFTQHLFSFALANVPELFGGTFGSSSLSKTIR